MSKMLDRVAKAIELAQGNAPYYVFPQFKNKYSVFKTNPPYCVDECMLALVSQEEAEDVCEKFNIVYMARKAVEALVPAEADMQNKYFEFATAEGYLARNACFPNAVWERAINAILKD